MSKAQYLKHFSTYYPEKQQTLVRFYGPRKYYVIFKQVIPNNFSKLFEERTGYDWGTYIHSVNSEDEHNTIIAFLDFLSKVVLIDDELDQCFALDYHHIPYTAGGGKSLLGELVRNAKPYNMPVTDAHCSYADRIADLMINFINTHPSYAEADFVVSVPYSREKDFDLPEHLVKRISDVLNLPNGNEFVYMTKPAQQMKRLTTLEEKIENIAGAFNVVQEHPFNDKVVVLIDDIYQSGATLYELATTLQQIGATVRGLVATKTISDID